VQVRKNTMASKNICTRCLRIAAAPTARPVAQNLALRRTFASSAASRQSSKPRQIHNSARQRAAPGVDSLHQPANAIPPNITPRGRTTDKEREDEIRAMLQPNNLFHSFSNSPSPAIRQRAAVMKQNAYCPHPEHQATRTPASPNDLEARKTGSLPPAHVRYECPDCGIPVSCSEDHFADDYEAHLEICDQLREINEDDHDLVSGRFFPEFEYPAATMDEAQVNLTNWDTMLYSREFNAIDDERAMRQVTRLLTYPITIGSVLHELSPYNISKSGRLTSEGLRSLSGTTLPL
jgi:splicing suppressor protein 51